MQIFKNTTGISNSGNNSSEQKKKILILASVILVLLSILIGVYIRLGIIKLPSSNKVSSDDTTKVTSNLPSLQPQAPNNASQTNQNQRLTSSNNNDSLPISYANLSPTNLIDPFSGPYNLTGVVVNNTGRNVAIIDGNGKSFVVAENDTIDNLWKVESVQLKQVVLSYNNKKYSLTMADNSK